MQPIPFGETVSNPKKTWYRTKLFNLTLGACFTALCLWWAMENMRQGPDPDQPKSWTQVFAEIADAFSKADYRSLPLIFTALALFYVVKAWRWKMLLEPIGRFRTVSDLLPSVMIGFAFNNVLPAHLGEFVRMFVFARQHRVPKTGVFSSIALERIFDIIAILSFLAAGMLFVDVSRIDRSVVISAWVFAGAVCAGLAGAAIYLTWTVPFVAAVERVTGWFVPEHLSRKISGILEAGATGLASLRSVRLLIGILLTSYLQWALNGFMIFLALWAFGIHVSPLVAAIVLGVVAVGVTVPSTPGYFGVIQVCFVLVLKLFVDQPQMQAVFAASIYYHMAQWIPVTAVGMLYFVRAGVRLAEIRTQAEQRDSPSLDRDSTRASTSATSTGP
ncbi:MAG: flippase-like domain-containing protein [Fuerstiella sp.]|nr:flippase-like domain-containing protein [Fuerstiella sp.]